MDEEIDKEVKCDNMSSHSCIEFEKNVYEYLSFLYRKKSNTSVKTEPYKIVYGFDTNKNTYKK